MFAFGALFWAVARPWWSFDSAEFAMTTSLLGVLDEVAVPVWIGVAWVIVLGTLAPYSLNLAALRHVPPTIVGAVGMCEPVVAAVVAWAWLGQALRPIQLVGGGVVLAGVALAQQAATSGSHVMDVPATVGPEELRIPGKWRGCSFARAGDRYAPEPWGSSFGFSSTRSRCGSPRWSSTGWMSTPPRPAAKC